MSEMVVRYAIGNNIVKGRDYHDVCIKTLDILSNALLQSFGPTGSNTAVYTNGIARYTKDGRSILESIRFNGVIEESVREDLKEITRNVDKNVGDGTTSAIILSSILFKKLIENNDKFKNPYEVIRMLNNISDNICERIRERRQEFTPKKAYDISMVSTNGDEFISNLISEIYETQGNEVFIDVQRSNDADTKIKVMDNLVLEDGFTDPSFINDPVHNKVIIKKPEIYIFNNQIDTPDMVQLMRTIINNNIAGPLNQKIADPNSNAKFVPTVIICPYISSDQAPFFNVLLQTMNSMPADDKLPLNVITTPKDQYKLHDIATLCGCKPIKKYIDPAAYEADVKAGLAATPENITEFAGHADMVISDISATQFVNPAKKYADDSHTELSDTFKGLLDFLEKEIRSSIERNDPIDHIGKMKRRLRTLKANMVELYIGGISSTDRDYYKDLVIDAVKNCRSAAENGCGYGANVEGLYAIHKYINSSDIVSITHEEVKLENILYESYKELVSLVYRNLDDVDKVVMNIINNGTPYNINSGEVDEKILCSIETDVEIIKSVIKIVSILFTCNQFIASSCALANPYQTL